MAETACCKASRPKRVNEFEEDRKQQGTQEGTWPARLKTPCYLQRFEAVPI